MQNDEFRGLNHKPKPKPDYSYLFRSSEEYGGWSYEQQSKKKHMKGKGKTYVFKEDIKSTE